MQPPPTREEIFTLLETLDKEIKRARFLLRQLF
jgi:hypothetical protein